MHVWGHMAFPACCCVCLAQLLACPGSLSLQQWGPAKAAEPQLAA
jgi:hypothetical protein